MKVKQVRLFALCLCMAGVAGADTTFLGGDMASTNNWDNGIPNGAGDPVGIVNTNGTFPSANQGATTFSGSAITVGGGATLTGAQDLPARGTTWVINDATLILGDDLFCDSGTITLNAGSAVNADDLLEAQSSGTLNINGGTHTAGGSFGFQGGPNRGTLNFFGGTVTSGKFRFDAPTTGSGSMNLGGSASAIATGTTDAAQIDGTVNVLPDWTGSLTAANFAGDDWKNAIVAGDWSWDGIAVDVSVFDASFAVISGGSTLLTLDSLANTPLFTTDPVVTTDGMYGVDYVGDLSGSATNAVGSLISYEKVDGLDWLVVATNGALSGIPTISGTNTFTVRAVAGAYSSTATLEIYIAPQGNPPEFTTNLIVKADGVIGEDYALLSQSLTNSAADLDGDTLTYSKVDGNSWLSIAPDGALSGVCDVIGTNDFVVRVDDGNGNFDEATLRVYVPAPTGGTVFLGGELGDATNWSFGLPSSLNSGTISVDGSYTNRNQAYAWTDGPDAEILVNDGAVLTLHQDFALSKAIWTITNATINCNDDFFLSGGGTVYLEEGSVTTANDDWEAILADSHIIVNGGMHTSGLAPAGSSQIGSQRPGCRIDFFGGTVSGVDFRFNAGTTNSVGGSAILIGSGTLSGADGAINMLTGWSGSWTLDAYGPGDWQAALTDPTKGFLMDGAPIDATVFANRFIVSVDGKTLTMAGVAAPVTLTVGPVVGGNIEVSWEGVAAVDYHVQTNLNLNLPSGWATWTTTTGVGPISVEVPTTADRNFIRVISE